MAEANSYSNPKASRKLRRRALLCSPKLGCVPKGSRTRVSGRFRSSTSISRLGTLVGALRSPSMSSEKANRRVGMSDNWWKAWRTIDVRATSPKVPMCGRPDGP